MPAYLDIAARDLTSYKKGDIVAVAIEGKQCSIDPSGALIGLTISDATREQVHHYIHDWKVDFLHTLNSQNAFGWQYIIEVDPIYISASDIGKAELKDKMQDHVNGGSQYWEGCQAVGFTSNSMTVNIPKDGPYQTAHGLDNIDFLKLLKSDFSDIFRTRLNVRRYHFSEADVDQVIADGGAITLTRAQALNRIIDRLEQ